MADDLYSLAADLTAASGKAQRMAGAAIRKAAHDVEARAKTSAPVDTGALRSSIGVDLSFGQLQAVVGPTVHYAPYIEYGHRAGRAGFVAPRPFMGPAAESVIPSLAEALEQIGGDIL